MPLTVPVIMATQSILPLLESVSTGQIQHFVPGTATSP